MGEEERRFPFDASSYILFEATGDSDAAHDCDQESDSAMAEDDAQSLCGAGTTDRRLHEVVDGVESDYCDGDQEEEVEEDTGSDEEDGVVDQCRRGTAAEPTKSKGFEKSESNAMMSEREGDKLFWEACLAS